MLQDDEVLILVRHDAWNSRFVAWVLSISGYKTRRGDWAIVLSMIGFW